MTITLLLWAIRICGVGQLVLAPLHLAFAKRLRWKEEAGRMSPVNETIFHVHTLFVCFALVLFGAVSLVDPAALLAPQAAARWLTGGIAVFWALRLYCQFFVFRSGLWRGKRFETAMHAVFTLSWTGLAAVYGAAFARTWSG